MPENDQTTQQEPQATQTQAATPPAPAPAPEARYVPAERFEAVVAQKFDAIRQAEEAKAQAAELNRQVADLMARMQQTQAAPQQAQAPHVPQQYQVPSSPQITQADIDRISSQKAAALLFNQKCNESVFAGRKAYADFDAKIQSLKGVAPGLDANGQPMLPQHFVEAALATKRAEHVLYALSNDLGEADRIMSLTPMEQAVELARLADKVSPTNAPDIVAQAEAARVVNNPIRPVVGVSRGPTTGEIPLEDPALPMEEFMRRRNENAWDSKFRKRA